MSKIAFIKLYEKLGLVTKSLVLLFTLIFFSLDFQIESSHLSKMIKIGWRESYGQTLKVSKFGYCNVEGVRLEKVIPATYQSNG